VRAADTSGKARRRARARIGGGVYGTSIEKLQEVGFGQILLPTSIVNGSARRNSWTASAPQME
jgi:hypothetical protein